jgi:hypothetical protein
MYIYRDDIYDTEGRLQDATNQVIFTGKKRSSAEFPLS